MELQGKRRLQTLGVAWLLWRWPAGKQALEDRVRLFSKGKRADLALWFLSSDPEPTMAPTAISVLKCQYTMLALLWLVWLAAHSNPASTLSWPTAGPTLAP